MPDPGSLKMAYPKVPAKITARTTADGACHLSLELRPCFFQAKQHDHEQEKDHDCAGIDRDLNQGDERSMEQKKQHRNDQEVDDQEQGRVQSVPTGQCHDG